MLRDEWPDALSRAVLTAIIDIELPAYLDTLDGLVRSQDVIVIAEVPILSFVEYVAFLLFHRKLPSVFMIHPYIILHKGDN